MKAAAPKLLDPSNVQADDVAMALTMLTGVKSIMVEPKNQDELGEK